MKRPSLSAPLAALTLALSAAPAAVSAQEIEGLAVSPASTVLTVTGQGQTSGKPDYAMFTAGVATTGTTASEALSANAAAMNRVVRALRSAGVAERDIQTSNLDLNPVYADRNRPAVSTLEQEMPRIIGYRANNQVMVKQRDPENFGRVIDTLVSAGANQVNGPNFQIDDTDSALDEARRQAMTKARERAQLYASAAGLRVKRILTITESGSYSPRPQMAYARMAADSAESTPVSPGEVELQANVTVMFELTP